ncbi:transposase family protein [Acidithrix ferrooxidans]|uniref:Transposase IS204/IS1001/IS1096/IS1165 zinc-finger domain-containing protein n=1 Tax=Acidithrix ferrooxidans TaxID=1280514 RepID=A0A0D8HCU7_9ACTN|nr:transposase family protein [Acidithrix ferrooxidans]KJF15549.1 hypothetical protein AXFE_36110 [Acidithrix ferrooxidans]KJF15719.1 hypothetical protein AXFE_34260 [Acidithrix ferrooxidans]KJF17656.1 hypothetical protein AXFE_14510 [Acidithrix ferrooxidans]
MEKDHKAISKILVGLVDINLIGVEDNLGEPLHVHIECSNSQKQCPTCEGKVHHNGLRVVEVVDLPSFGRKVILFWSKHRWRCANKHCPQPSFSDDDPKIAQFQIPTRSSSPK